MEQAIYKIGILETVATSTYNINYYISGRLLAFKNCKIYISDKFCFSLRIFFAETEWRSLVQIFLNNAEKFFTYVEQLNHNLFDHLFIDKKYGNYLHNIEGVIEHSYYHLMQIFLKMM